MGCSISIPFPLANFGLLPRGHLDVVHRLQRFEARADFDGLGGGLIGLHETFSLRLAGCEVQPILCIGRTPPPKGAVPCC